MHLSIVIPTKNEEDYLPLLLSSIATQTLVDKEVIVADAASTDQTRAMALAAGAKIVDGGLPGPGRNIGATHAQGDVILFLDADVVLPEAPYLADCLEEMQRKNFDVATCLPLASDGDAIDHMMHEAYNVYAKATESFLPHAGGFCIFATREAHKKLNGFDEKVVFAEDHDYVRRARKMDLTFGILRSHKVPVSVRRLRKEGRARLALKYMYSELQLVTQGSIKRLPFKYDFADYEKRKRKDA